MTRAAQSYCPMKAVRLVAITQGRQRQFDDVEPMVEVGTEAALLKQRFQRLIARSDDSHIHRYFPVRSDRTHGFPLDHVQQLWLQGNGRSFTSSRKIVPC